jgi:XapX domain-containing protein
MKTYVISLGAGLLVGVIYSLLNVRSPAPPVVALIGLFGMLVGEQVVPVGRQVLNGQAFAAACEQARCASHLFGALPGRHAETARATAVAPPTEVRS